LIAPKTETMDVAEDLWIMPSNGLNKTESHQNQLIHTLPETDIAIHSNLYSKKLALLMSQDHHHLN